MKHANRTAVLVLAALLTGITLAGSACFVSLDESLIQEGTSADAGTDVDSSIVKEGGDVEDEGETKPETGVDAEAGTDVVEDVEDIDADAQADVESDVSTDVQEAGDVEQPDADAGDLFDGALVECYDQTWCPPVGCMLRKCDKGACTLAGSMKEVVTTFELPATLQCNQSTNRTCVVAVRNYLVALTGEGFTVFNTRNPYDVREEFVPNNIGSGYAHLVRSGERVWAVRNSAATTTEVAWLDIPMDGVSPVSPPTVKQLYVPLISARHAAPNDALYLYHRDPGLGEGYVARYAPGITVNLVSYATNDAMEALAMASSGGRLLLNERVTIPSTPTTYRHNFSLQSDLTSAQSMNSGTYQEASLTNTHGTYGFFGSSRTGAIAWVIGRRDNVMEWKDVRVYWVVADGTASIVPASLVLESYNTQPPTTPEGPLAFINDDTIATAVYSGTASPSPTLGISRRQTGLPPQLVKRIPLSALPSGLFNVAGDGGYAYVIISTTVRMFAPSCNP